MKKLLSSLLSLLIVGNVFGGNSTYSFPSSVELDPLFSAWLSPFVKVLPIQSAKLGGTFVTAPAQINGGANTWELLFDASTTESAVWQFRLPANYTDTPIAVLQFSMASATSGKVDLEVEVMAVADGEAVDTASFDSVNEVSGGTSVPGTAGLLKVVAIPLTNADSMGAGELVIIRINRDHDDADDDASGDLELKSITLTWE